MDPVSRDYQQRFLAFKNTVLFTGDVTHADLPLRKTQNKSNGKNSLYRIHHQ